MLAGLAAPKGETRPTSEDKSALVDKEMAVVVPFGGVAIYWPTLAELGNAIAIEDIALGAIDVAPNSRLRFFLGDIVDHTGWECLVGRFKGEHTSTTPAHPSSISITRGYPSRSQVQST